MSGELREAFEDLVGDVPRHVVPPDLAGAAWAEGRRRRRRRMVAGSALALALAVLMVLTVLPMAEELRTLQPAGGEVGVSDYPERIDRQWWVRDLPDRPGPVAGLVKVRRSGDVQWHAITERGHRWRVPENGASWDDSYPTVSSDGTRLGYLSEPARSYVIHDLTTGEVVPFDVSNGHPDAAARYAVQGQSPSFWSPDGSRVATLGWDTVEETGGVLILGVDGSLTWLPDNAIGGDAGERFASPAGWVSHDEVAILAWTPEDSDESFPVVGEVVVRHVSLEGDVRRTVPLRPSTPWQERGFYQWSGVVSPDGSQLLIADDVNFSDHLVRVFSVGDGVEVAEPAAGGSGPFPCPRGWAGAEPAVAYRDHPGGVAVTAVPDRSADYSRLEPIVAVGIGSECLIWASDAIAQAPKDGLFALRGDNPWLWPWRELQGVWWAWFWREIALVVLLGTGAIVTLRWWRRRRSQPVGSGGE